MEQNLPEAWAVMSLAEWEKKAQITLMKSANRSLEENTWLTAQILPTATSHNNA